MSYQNMIVRSLIACLVLSSTTFAAQKVVVVVDDSGSMLDRMRYERIRKMDAAKQSLRVVLEKLPADAEVGVLALNRGWVMPFQTIDRRQLESQVNRLRASGGTPLGMRMREATDKLLELRSKDPYGDYRLLVVTDGEASDQGLLDAILPDIMARNFVVDVIGVDMESEHSLATAVTAYRRADDPSSLEEAIAESLAESDESDLVGGESDFELIAGLPVEIAPVLISSLTTANNAPIGEVTMDGSDFGQGGGNTVFQPSLRQTSSSSSSGGGGFSFSGIFFMMILIFAISTVSSILKKLSRPTRRRRTW